MKAVILFVLLIFTSNTFSQNVSPQFSELKGMEDQQGNTHLFYRIYTSSYDSVSYWTISSNNIYHFDLLTQEDTLFLESYYGVDSIYFFPEEFVIRDLTFWQSNPIYFIYCGVTEITILNEHIFIKRFDSENTYDKRGSIDVIEISKQNDSLLYAGVSVFDTSGLELTIKSTDGGWNWVKVPGIYQLKSLSPFNDQLFFARDVIGMKLYKTTNGGSSFYIVDSLRTYWEQQYHYDPNENHIYRVLRNFYTNDYELKVSSSGGEAFSWASKYTSPTQIFISNNKSVTGEVYFADGKNIFLSTDFGNNFTLYKSLDRNIVGIYKKPNSDKLYAATKYKIYEITPGSIQIIKSLPIPNEVFNLYPLAIGNKWVYDYLIDPDDPQQEGDAGIHIREITKDTVLANGKFYAKVYDETLNYYGTFVYERADSVSGKVFRYYEDPLLEENEYAIHDLLAEVGDTINTSRNFYGQSLFTTVLGTSTFSKWGVTKPKKIFQEYSLSMLTYSLTEKFGLDSIYFIFDFGYGRTELKGAIIDGVVYGDTTVVSVEDETYNLLTEFSLSQNYPNPFNPSTKIKYALSSRQYATLKVYDILGNEVTTLVNEELPAGEYEVEFNSRGLIHQSLSSGIYFYQLKAGTFIQSKKMLLLK